MRELPRKKCSFVRSQGSTRSGQIQIDMAQKPVCLSGAEVKLTASSFRALKNNSISYGFSCSQR